MKSASRHRSLGMMVAAAIAATLTVSCSPQPGGRGAGRS